MMPKAEQFPFVALDPSLGAASLLPYLPITLLFRQSAAPVMGLLDTAATVNVLPYAVGQQLGAIWEEQTTSVQLTGNLAQQEARVLLLAGSVAKFPPVRLAFAWTWQRTANQRDATLSSFKVLVFLRHRLHDRYSPFDASDL